MYYNKDRGYWIRSGYDDDYEDDTSRGYDERYSYIMSDVVNIRNRYKMIDGAAIEPVSFRTRVQLLNHLITH